MYSLLFGILLMKMFSTIYKCGPIPEHSVTQICFENVHFSLHIHH